MMCTNKNYAMKHNSDNGDKATGIVDLGYEVRTAVIRRCLWPVTPGDTIDIH
jgi:hypothetical protein